MSEASKAAEKFAYTDVKQLLIDGVIPSDAGTLEIAEYSHSAGARALLEWAKAQVPNPDTEDEWFLELLQSYFAEEKK